MKVFAFIDSQNLNLGVLEQRWRLDFARFRVYLKEKYLVEKAFLFVGFLPKNQSLYSNLQEFGYVLIFKPTLELKSGEVKGNVDAELVLHTMIQFPNYDKAVIVTGDGDFYCLVDYLSKQNKLMRLIVPNQGKYSRLLKPFAPNNISFVSDLKVKLELTKKRGNS